MFEYFPGNYVWNLSVCIALQSGAQIGEVDEMCRPIREAAQRGEDAGTADFAASWMAMADKLVGLAAEDEYLSRRFSESAKLNRAALYCQVAERMLANTNPLRRRAYADGQASFSRAMALGKENCTRVEIPYRGGVIPGLFTRAAVPGPSPCLVFINGLDSSKEMLFWTGLGRELARRGVATLHIDQPGTGEALRTYGLTAVVETERWAAVVLDHLTERSDVLPDRIGLLGLSLGGFYAPRAVAFEPRFALGAVWGANHDWGATQRRRLAREGDRPVPHYWEHVQWVWGADSVDDFMAMAERTNLDGVMERITVPFLVTHGENDRQIPLADAHRSFAGLVNSPKRALKVFTSHEGGVEHVGADNMSFGRDFIADWVSETFAQMEPHP